MSARDDIEAAALRELRRRPALLVDDAVLEALEAAPEHAPALPDGRLELLFACCHPALELDAQVALTLRTVAGLTTGEIARAFDWRQIAAPYGSLAVLSPSPVVELNRAAAIGMAEGLAGLTHADAVRARRGHRAGGPLTAAREDTRVIEWDLRLGPSANVVRAGGVLVDSGSGSVAAVARTRAFAAGATELVLTHFHADHAGGAGLLGLPVAAHATEAALVNARDPRACDGEWLGFGVNAYDVQRALEDGDRVGELEVVHTPGQTPGHIALWHPGERVAITGDLLQASDVAWIPFAGPWADGALDRTVASIERIAALGPRMTIPGHGPPVTDVADAVRRTLARYEQFRAEPEKAVWHAVRRAVVSHVMTGPIGVREIAAMPWARGAAGTLGTDAATLIAAALDGLEDRGAVYRENGRYDTRLEHEPRGPLANPPGRPTEWAAPSPRSAPRRGRSRTPDAG